MIANHNSRSRFRVVTLMLFCMLLLGNMIGCSTLTVPSASTLTPTVSFTPTSTAIPTETPTPTLTATATQPPVLCGGPPVMYILLIGSDARGKSYSVGLADSIRLVRVDFVRPSIHVLAFPRDLYVEIPDISNHHGITHGKLNQAYLYGNPGYGYYDSPDQGPGLLALTLEQNFGTHTDHYIAVNLQSFTRMVDALGGIDVDLPHAIDGRVKGSKDSNLYFKAGKQHLKGYRTMLLARLRPQGDFQRIEIQNLIMNAVAEKLFSPAALIKIPSLIEAFVGSVQSDIGTAEANQLLCLSSKLDVQNIQFEDFPETLFKITRVQDPVVGNTSILKADFNVLGEYVRMFNEGKPFQPGVTPPRYNQPSVTRESPYTVEALSPSYR